MLKTLRITSLVALIAAVCGVVAIGVVGLRGDSEIQAFLDKPGVVDDAKERKTDDTAPKEVESPLVIQSRLFALRIDPPPPPKPKVEPKTKDPVASKPPVREKPKPKPPVTPPRPKPPVNAKFTVLGTVLCEANPARSMTLLEQTGGKQEWFRQGERVGHLDVQEVRDGSVIFSQSGRNPQELFVAPKPKVKSLLKNVATSSIPSSGGANSINVKLGPEPSQPVVGGSTAATADTRTSTDRRSTAVDSRSASTITETGRVRIERSKAAIEAQTAAADKVRVRVAPKVKTPQEQEATIEKNISSIQEIMSRDATSDPEMKKKENEAWLELLKALEGEKKNLEERVKEEADDETKTEPDPKAAPKRR